MDYSVNLNPMGIPDSIAEAVSEGLKHIGEYPSYDQAVIRRALAKSHDIRPEQVICGNGASELIMAAVRAVNPRNALIIEPSFYGYTHAINSLEDCCVSRFMLKEENDFRLTPDITGEITEDTDILFLTSPWNPMGYTPDKEVITKILHKAAECGCYVVMDESFYLLSDCFEKNGCSLHNTIKEALEAYNNLYIIRTFTKFTATPGIRCGYIMSTNNNIGQIAKQLSEWNLSTVAGSVTRAAAQLMDDEEYMTRLMNYVNRERDYLSDSLRKRGCRVYDSNTVYIMFKTKEDIYTKLLNKGILIRDCSNYNGLRKGYYRIAVKDHDSNINLVEALEAEE